MKIAGVIALVLSSAITTSASAFQANQTEVKEANVQGRQLTWGERNFIKAKIVGAEVLLGQLRFHRKQVALFGFEEQRGLGAASLVIGLPLAEVLIGAKLIQKTPDAATQLIVAKTDAYYQEINVAKAKIAEQTKILKVLDQAPTATRDSVKITETRALITAEETGLATLGTNVAKEVAASSRLVRAARAGTIVLGGTVGVALVADGVVSAYRFLIAPEQMADTEARLSSYIDNARAIVDARR